MLVLSRFIGEKIIIDDNIIVVVSRIEKPNKVTIGVSAPNNISVHREEIHLRIKAEEKKKQKINLPDNSNK